MNQTVEVLNKILKQHAQALLLLLFLATVCGWLALTLDR
jgi:hypothetical protein